MFAIDQSLIGSYRAAALRAEAAADARARRVAGPSPLAALLRRLTR